ncbi:hypothetical protein EVAR_90157_1 [Eumeta japonica]|uniref:Uncharacterized protein n=1 Tax=Eumeta variegata TaxID=151549 RepID=A0A4C1Z527_EUMVA|nr:hypothetical protein EVAR_90157_1 [Eumeta japonica]
MNIVSEEWVEESAAGLGGGVSGMRQRKPVNVSRSPSTDMTLSIEDYEIIRCVRPLSLFYSDTSADGVDERSLVLHSRSHARLKRNVTMIHTFSCVQPAFIDL